MPLVPPILVAVLLGIAFLALIPTRRLFQRGASGAMVGLYFLALWILGIAIVATPRTGRLLIPVVIVLAIAPYVHLRDGVDRLLGRPPRPTKPPMKNVTPDEPDTSGTGSTAR